MKISFVYWSLTPVGGVERMMSTMMESFAGKGDDVTFIHIRPKTSPTLLTDLPRVSAIYLNATNIVSAMWRMQRFFRQTPPDLVYTAMPTTNIAVLVSRLLSFHRFPVVISERSDPAGESRMNHSWRYKAAIQLARYVYPFADHVVCVSRGLASSLTETIPIDPERLSVIYNPVVRGSPVALPARAQPPHPWLGRPRDCPVILTAGRLAKEKDFATLIEAFALLRKSKPARLIILGEGAMRPGLQSQIERKGLGQDAILPGAVPDIGPWLQHADVFVVSSLYEGFGNALVEAMAAGCQVVSTDCPFGPREILQSGLYGRLVPVGDAPAMALVIEQTLQDPVDREALIRRSLDFSVSASLVAYDSLFRRLTAAQNNPYATAQIPPR